MNKKIIIIGAGGHGRVVKDVALLCGYDTVCFLDDDDSYRENECVIGKVSNYEKIDDFDFFVAIGNNIVREEITKKLIANNKDIATLIHPDAVVGTNVRIGMGSVIMAGTVLNTGAVIGNGAIINTSSSVDHDSVVGDFCHISVGAHLAGNVKIGERTFVGAGAVVINNTYVCNDCMIGAGAVVAQNIEVTGTYVGVPAKKKSIENR